MNEVFEYFYSDPLRILYLLGGSGGIWFWIAKWRDRIQLKVRVIDEGRYISSQLNEKSYSEFEMENIGGRITSLQPIVILKAYAPNGKFQRYEGEITALERDLSPHKPKEFRVVFNAGDVFEFLLFRVYSFKLTRGHSKSLRVRSASHEIISPWRFIYELLCFKWFGRYNEPKK